MSPSSPAWVNYDEGKMERVFFANEAARRGSEMHAFAHQAIRLGIKLPDTKKTINQYVNDAIGFKMTSEVILWYSENCFGTADSIGLKVKHPEPDLLRIHDLKNGITIAGFPQLEIYAALFCLEYNYKPGALEIELRIYQGDAVKIHNPEPDRIFHVMDRIITFDRQLTALRKEVP